MRGIMQARTKPLEVIDSVTEKEFSQSKSFEKPEEKGQCKLVDPNDVAKLVDLLHNEAKVI
jgi:electron transfer flavoprotein beta subunit